MARPPLAGRGSDTSGATDTGSCQSLTGAFARAIVAPRGAGRNRSPYGCRAEGSGTYRREIGGMSAAGWSRQPSPTNRGDFMSSPEPTTSTRNVVTQDPHVAHDWLAAGFAAFPPKRPNTSRDFRFRGRHLPLGDNGVLAQLRYSLSADNNLSNSDILVVQPFDGRMKVSLGHDEEVVPVGTPVLLPAHQVVSVLWADACADCVGVRAAEVERAATETTGLENAALRFTALRPMTPALGRRWNDVVRDVVDTLMRQPGGTPSPLVAAQLTHRLAAAALETFPSTILASRRRMPPDPPTPPVVRPAIDR